MDIELRTDLAVELNEGLSDKDRENRGIIHRDWTYEKVGVKVTELEIVNKRGEKLLGRPQGRYVTIEAKELNIYDEFYEGEVVRITSGILEEMIRQVTHHKDYITILVVGLGNKDVTADALGPLVVENISVDRHMGNQRNGIKISGIAPGVMAQTGMETASIVKGIVAECSPDVVVAIDALAARSSSRLNTTIQISDKGITPGSGVGNHRLALNEETLGIPVIAMGVPTVISVPTIVADTMENLLSVLSANSHYKGVEHVYYEFSQPEKMALIREVLSEEMADMVVTPKDIDASVRTIAYIIAGAIDKACKS